MDNLTHISKELLRLYTPTYIVLSLEMVKDNGSNFIISNQKKTNDNVHTSQRQQLVIGQRTEVGCPPEQK